MNLGGIKRFGKNRSGGLKKLAADIGMSEQICIDVLGITKYKQMFLEQIALKLNVDILQFFDDEVKALANSLDTQTYERMPIKDDNRELIELCKSLVANFQQRDDVMSKLVSMVKGMEE